MWWHVCQGVLPTIFYLILTSLYETCPYSHFRDGEMGLSERDSQSYTANMMWNRTWASAPEPLPTPKPEPWPCPDLIMRSPVAEVEGWEPSCHFILFFGSLSPADIPSVTTAEVCLWAPTAALGRGGAWHHPAYGQDPWSLDQCSRVARDWGNVFSSSPAG